MTGCYEAAITYARMGWRVMPTWWVDEGVCACAKGPACQATGKHPIPSAWQEKATTDEAVIRAWWTQWPLANVSVATGAASGVFVVDVDVRGGGVESADEYDRLSEQGLPPTLRARTGSGGFHLFYRVPPSAVVRTRGAWLPGVDVRGEGGQVVAPPSLHASGAWYAWEGLWEAGPQEPPAELVAALSTTSGDQRDALPTAAEILAGVGEGQRDEVLFRWACRLRRQLRDDRAAVEVLVLEAARRATPPFPEEEARKCVDSAFKQDHSEEEVSWVGGGVGLDAGGAAPGDEEGVSGEVGRRPLTDLGNAYRMWDRHGQEIAWSGGRGWMAWDGRRWARDEARVHRLAQLTAESVWHEVPLEQDADAQDKIVRWARSSQSSGHISAAQRELQPLVTVDDDLFDDDDWTLVVANGVVDLRTGELLPHDRERRVTKCSPARYDPEADAPHWRSFIEMILPDEGVRDFVQRAAGYTLTGDTSEKCLLVLWGRGNNGKSTMVETLRNLVLGDYASVVPKGAVMGRGESNPTERVGMVGARLVTLGEEVGRGDVVRSDVVKAVTGGDEMSARYLYGQWMSFRPRAKLWLPTNYRPGLTDFGKAMASRLRLVPFEVDIAATGRGLPREMVDRILKEETSGVLNWCLEGLARWRDRPLSDAPAVVVAAKEEWLEDEDWVAAFLRDETGSVNEGEWALATEVYGRYVSWAMLHGEKAVGGRTLARELSSRGVRKGNDPNTRAVCWELGLRVVAAPSVWTSN